MFSKFKKSKYLLDSLPKYNKRTVDIEGSTFVLRRATMSDIDMLIKIEEAVYNGSAPWLLRDFVSELSRPHIRLYLVIERRDQIIGFAGAALRNDIHDIHVTNIAIVPVWQGNGLGTTLLKELYQLTRKLNVVTMSLEARISNVKAITLYERLGYRQTGVKKGYYLDNREDAVSMVLNFDDSTSDN
ncbi:ribosomal-protein-alanine acetyltransferase [Leuconostoc litchii]|uniref:Ribosomal-protein-alanine N-acetyltransferase n=1 Tax=Leuconostoc litchii TaxID=1981069 RepID=A0A652NE00_9LACO|nr:ribosomal protein S18-alanine N-acetyltransferase [Leuconostoc litchii]TYC46497.1 ribosomal-protein-alanine N-acetyltransferase [Leuconostoc litchii]GMA70188.1 ribosomal-protein-alanine acetyltransferase [Leuconostoc litchii]